MKKALRQDYIDCLRTLNYELIRELGLFKFRAGLSFNERHTLYHISNHKGLSILELSDLLHLSHSTMSRNIKRLQKIGMVELTQSDSDKRCKKIHLTELGYDNLNAATESINQTISFAVDRMSDIEVRSVIAAIRLYSNALKQKDNDGKDNDCLPE